MFERLTDDADTLQYCHDIHDDLVAIPFGDGLKDDGARKLSDPDDYRSASHSSYCKTYQS
jgi:hypothetical protein